MDLRELPYWLLLPFTPKFWESDEDLQMIFCQSVSTVQVVRTLIGGDNTRTLTAIIELI